MQISLTLPEIPVYALQLAVFDSGERALAQARALQQEGIRCMVWQREKMRLIAALMEDRGLTFRDACENVGITDLSHGYRLFKRYMGVTPKQYMSAERMHLQE